MELLIILAVAAAVIFGYRWIKRPSSSGPSTPRARLQEAKAALPLLPDRFIVLDLETTGLKPDTHEIIEVAAIKVNRDSIHHDGYQALVKPTRKVPKRITDLTGITQDMLDAQGEPLEKVMRELHAFVGDLRVVTYNAEFDMAFLRRAASSFGLEFTNPVSCALQMARRTWPDRKSFRLADIAGDGGIDVSESHRALGDCKRALVVYFACVTELQRLD